MQQGNTIWSSRALFGAACSEWQGAKGDKAVFGPFAVHSMTMHREKFGPAAKSVYKATRHFIMSDNFGNYFIWQTGAETKIGKSLQPKVGRGQKVYVDAIIKAHIKLPTQNGLYPERDGKAEITVLSRPTFMDELPPRKEGELRTRVVDVQFACMMRAEAGTNCPMGGDAGHGGITVVTLTDQGGTAWAVDIIDVNGEVAQFDQPSEIKLVAFGDSEAETLAVSLEFAARTIREQCGFDPDAVVEMDEDEEEAFRAAARDEQELQEFITAREGATVIEMCAMESEGRRLTKIRE